jgi:phosphoribosylformylglycinamidine (FGAM) synthase-like enzyme
VIGRVIEEPVVRVRHRGEVVAEVSPDHLTKACPTYTLQADEPAYLREAQRLELAEVPVPDDMNAVLLALLESPTIASKRWVYEQYDWLVGTQTILPPGAGDAAALRIRGSERGIALTIDCNARYCYLHPYRGGQIAVAEAARNLACVGAQPRAITDCLNFGNPQRPEIYYQFEQAVRGIADASEFFGTPVVSGNVSFYNESEFGAVYPTPTIGMLGILERPEDAVGMGFRAAGDVVLLVCPASRPADAEPHFGIGASEYLYGLHGLERGAPDPVDLAAERALASPAGGTGASSAGALDARPERGRVRRCAGGVRAGTWRRRAGEPHGRCERGRAAPRRRAVRRAADARDSLGVSPQHAGAIVALAHAAWAGVLRDWRDGRRPPAHPLERRIV